MHSIHPTVSSTRGSTEYIQDFPLCSLTVLLFHPIGQGVPTCLRHPPQDVPQVTGQPGRVGEFGIHDRSLVNQFLLEQFRSPSSPTHHLGEDKGALQATLPLGFAFLFVVVEACVGDWEEKRGQWVGESVERRGKALATEGKEEGRREKGRSARARERERKEEGKRINTYQ